MSRPDPAPPLHGRAQQPRAPLPSFRATVSEAIEHRVSARDRRPAGGVRGVLISLILGGHVLLEGAPGLGKTLLVRTSPGPRPQLQPHPVHPRPDAGRRHRARTSRDGGRRAPRCVPARARSSRRSSWRTRSTARRRRRRARCSRRCRSTRSPIGGAAPRAAGAVLRARDREPDRDGGNLPAARGAARPLPLKLLVEPPDGDEMTAILVRTALERRAAAGPSRRGRALAWGRSPRVAPVAPPVLGTPRRSCSSSFVRRRAGARPRSSGSGRPARCAGAVLGRRRPALLDGRHTWPSRTSQPSPCRRSATG